MHLQFMDLPIRIRLISKRNDKEKVYCAPSAGEIAALIIGDFGQGDTDRDVIVEHKDEGLMRISELHPLFMSMQYPLLFPYGEDGFHPNIRYLESPVKDIVIREKVSMQEYYAYLIQQRRVRQNTLLRGGRLLQ